MRIAIRIAAVAAAAVLTGGLVALTPAQARTPAPQSVAVQSTTTVVHTAVHPDAAKYKFKNCTALHKVYQHGVGKTHAHDKTSGTPVTSFKHSTKLYKKIIGYRSGLDRDKDGIACEKR